MGSSEAHYDSEYFEWQRKIGEFGGKANLFKFSDYIRMNDNICDFGCGGGYLLKNIKTSGKKIGIEINPAARETARSNGIECYENILSLDDNSVDILISNHALEHVNNPIYYIEQFKRVVKKNGTIAIVVPHEMSFKVNKEDINMHLFTWAPQNLYNLFRTCGIEVVQCKNICHAWMPNYLRIQKLFGWKIFHKLCVLYCIKTKLYQSLVVGRNKK